MLGHKLKGMTKFQSMPKIDTWKLGRKCPVLDQVNGDYVLYKDFTEYYHLAAATIRDYELLLRDANEVIQNLKA